jgi:hypothetical protein
MLAETTRVWPSIWNGMTSAACNRSASLPTSPLLSESDTSTANSSAPIRVTR